MTWFFKRKELNMRTHNVERRYIMCVVHNSDRWYCKYQILFAFDFTLLVTELYKNYPSSLGIRASLTWHCTMSWRWVCLGTNNNSLYVVYYTVDTIDTFSWTLSKSQLEKNQIFCAMALVTGITHIQHNQGTCFGDKTRLGNIHKYIYIP